MPIVQYLSRIQSVLSSGNATEHSYRPELRDLFEELTEFQVINEPKGSEHGKPDFIFLKGPIPIAYGEAKDMHINLEKIEKSEQLARYFGYAKLILTNGIEFRFYKNGVRYGEPIVLAMKSGSSLAFQDENFGIFRDRLADFLSSPADTIRRSSHLAEIMGGKARRIRDNLREMMEREDRYEDIWKLYNTFKSEILHDLTHEDFADLYAQTLVYGLFVARYHDETPDDFSRGEARDLVPKSNPLLRRFFDHIAGEAFEKRLAYIVDELCDIFAHANVSDMMHGMYQKETHDPVIHFYEDFLGEYDDALRKLRGVFYTPAPVVKFIIRAVDDVLKTHFGLAKGLADTSKIEQKVYLQKDTKGGARKQATEMVHRVQILDPATGTGTFLNEIIHYIHAKMAGQAGMWPSYVENDLLPRLHGFELMMASYTIAHLKIGLTLAETGVTHLDRRLQIYLTNSLEEAKSKKEDQGTLFGLLESITDEARQADEVKRDKPVMIVVGNPPYSVSSTNKGEWIQNLLTDYKKGLGEKKINLDDDYIKFIRFGESLIEKNGEGVLAYISNNSFIDGITHRQMRKHLMETFDSIYILDLHGSAKKKETALDGSKDENVFDIMQGVSINIFIKNSPLEGSPKAGVAKKLAEVHHLDLYGKRNDKYEWLENHSLEDFQQLQPVEPYYFFVPKDFSENVEYEKGFKVDELMKINSNGVETQRDGMNIFYSDSDRKNILNIFQNLDETMLRSKYGLEDGRDWKVQTAKDDLIKSHILSASIQYRPFDYRFMNYTGKTKGIMAYPRLNVMKHFIHGANIGLLVCRQTTQDFRHIFITSDIVDGNITASAKLLGTATIFPLYLYPDSNGTTPPSGHPSKGGESCPRGGELSGGDISQGGEFSNRVANLDPTIAEKIAQSIGMRYAPAETSPKTIFANFPPISVDGISAGNSPPLEGCPKGGVVASESSTTEILTPEEILDYIYAVLHSPSYREKYREFLKIDFPRVPYPKDRESFDALVKLGGELRVLHLLESPKVEEYITTFPVAGTNEVGKVLSRLTDIPSHGREILPENSPSAEGVAFDAGEGRGRFPLRKLGDLPYNPLLKERARELRTQGILSEVLFWNMVKNKQILGLDFDRQRIIGNYIVDFYLSSLGMVFEIDGSSHDDKMEYDANRDEFLQSLGLQVIHILDHDVKKNIEGVMHIVRESIEKRRLEFEETNQSSGQPPRPVGHPSMGGEFSEQTQYGASGDDFLDIYINDAQYFGDVPSVAWEFYIGGYQPAQKWLKDRKGRILTWEDIAHYQSMIVALTETARVMGEVDKVLEV